MSDNEKKHPLLLEIERTIYLANANLEQFCSNLATLRPFIDAANNGMFRSDDSVDVLILSEAIGKIVEGGKLVADFQEKYYECLAKADLEKTMIKVKEEASTEEK